MSTRTKEMGFICYKLQNLNFWNVNLLTILNKSTIISRGKVGIASNDGTDQYCSKGVIPMEITNVKIRKISSDGKMKAVASVTFDDAFVVHDIKVIENEDKVFVAMPNRRMKDGTFKDVAHPVNFETRKYIEEIIINAYNEAEDPAEEI